MRPWFVNTIYPALTEIRDFAVLLLRDAAKVVLVASVGWLLVRTLVFMFDEPNDDGLYSLIMEWIPLVGLVGLLGFYVISVAFLLIYSLTAAKKTWLGNPSSKEEEGR